METPETRAKIANAIRQLESSGRQVEIPALVSAYKAKYKAQTPASESTPIDTAGTNTYGATFRASTDDNPLEAGLKAAGNLPSSAFNFAKGIYTAATNPIDTLKGAGDAILGGINKGVEKLTGYQIERGESGEKKNVTFDAITNSLKDRYGSLENLQRTATEDPFGFGSEILGLISGGSSLLGKGAQTANAIERVGQIAAKPVTAAAEAASSIGTKAATKILSYTSDVPEQAFQKLLANRETIVPKIGEVDPAKALDTARVATRGLRKTLSAEWAESVPKIIDEFNGQRMNISGRTEKLLDTVSDEFGIEVPQNIKSVSVNESINLLKRINELPEALLSFSPKGASVRELKQLLKSQVIETFGGESGSVANLYKNYSAKKSVFDAANDIVSAYKEGRPIKDTTAMNRLQNIFDENKPAYLDAILDLERATGVNIIDDVVASKFKKIAPNTLDRISAAGGMATKKGLLDKAINLLAFPLTSPRGAAFIQRNLKVPEAFRKAANVKVNPASLLLAPKGNDLVEEE